MFCPAAKAVVAVMDVEGTVWDRLTVYVPPLFAPVPVPKAVM